MTLEVVFVLMYPFGTNPSAADEGFERYSLLDVGRTDIGGEVRQFPVEFGWGNPILGQNFEFG